MEDLEDGVSQIQGMLPDVSVVVWGGLAGVWALNPDFFNGNLPPRDQALVVSPGRDTKHGLRRLRPCPDVWSWEFSLKIDFFPMDFGVPGVIQQVSWGVTAKSQTPTDKPAGSSHGDPPGWEFSSQRFILVVFRETPWKSSKGSPKPSRKIFDIPF